MTDLLGDTITSHTSARHSLIDPAWGFKDWWKCLPSHHRKVGKPQALILWGKLGCAGDATLIHQYTLWIREQDDWVRGFMPLPCTFLRREGWIDWDVIDVKVKSERDPELAKLDNDKKMAAKPSPAVLAQIAAIRQRVAA